LSVKISHFLYSLLKRKLKVRGSIQKKATQ